jgi:carbamoyl-phosphate synthase small subunit
MSATEILNLCPHGIVLSNGPGDPMACVNSIQIIKDLIEQDIPLLGICLGHQLLALAFGAKTCKMRFGHHGANHPVVDLSTQCVMITSQNHGFIVDEVSLPIVLKPTHRSLFDGTLQGFVHISKPIYGFQGHPEASPGPHDALGIFSSFMDAVKLYLQYSNKKEYPIYA